MLVGDIPAQDIPLLVAETNLDPGFAIDQYLKLVANAEPRNGIKRAAAPLTQPRALHRYPSAPVRQFLRVVGDGLLNLVVLRKR
ncbi:hypothetical protein SDC9_140641 [bioreactor metagenome]|uniref:Uncharacterized protein n=1 Tax=bioreactor metagenome TaxID=1076179 RepID=A0A645DY34_9ZZZZ